MTKLALVGALSLFVATASLAHADTEPDADVVAAATEADVSAIDLLGALNTTHLDPVTYLCAADGVLCPPAPPTPSYAISGVWASLARCESGGNWHIATGNGYYGGLQEDLRFWRSYGGTAYAPRPDLASPAAQIAVATRGQAVQGWGAWPVCSRRVGLR